MVIQRWQSVFLLIAAILMGVYSFTPIATVAVAETTTEVSMLGTVTEGGAYMWGFFWVSLLTSLLALVTIFKYKTLKLQKRLCLVGGSIAAALTVSLMIVLYNVECDVLSLSMTNLMPIVSIFMFYFANLGISKDIKILSSYDRIR
ncbi:MAG: DUF4293 domain-containing protein [Muribaculaceae bacterium]